MIVSHEKGMLPFSQNTHLRTPHLLCETRQLTPLKSWRIPPSLVLLLFKELISILSHSHSRVREHMLPRERCLFRARFSFKRKCFSALFLPGGRAFARSENDRYSFPFRFLLRMPCYVSYILWEHWLFRTSAIFCTILSTTRTYCQH